MKCDVGNQELYYKPSEVNDTYANAREKERKEKRKKELPIRPQIYETMR
jgi:hypothetical protein